MQNKYRLYYFDARGRGEIIRWIFAYARQNYEAVRIDRKTQWSQLKHKAPYGKVPFLEVDGRVLGESHAIQRYLAKKFHLTGKDEWEEAQADALADFLKEARRKFPTWVTAAVIEKNLERADVIKSEYLKESAAVLDRLEAQLHDNESQGQYFIGTKPTWADFVATHFLDSLTQFEPDILGDHPCLQDLQRRVKDLDGIRQWIAQRPQMPF